MDENQPDTMRVLAVDDEQHVRELYEEFLSSPTDNYKFALTLCVRSEEAVEAVRKAIEEKNHFALAFIDIRMESGPDGLWAAEQIRRLDPNIEIVIVTAHGDVGPEEITARVPPPGKLLYIRKPFSPDEIKQFAVSLSAKWQQEVHLRKIQAKLESHVEERTIDLIKANEQLKREIEERKRVGEELRKREERYRTILESIEDGYFEVNLSGDFTFFNDALCRIAGYSRNEMMGMNNRDYTTPETAKEMFQIFNQIYMTGKPASIVDYEILRKDGSTRVLEMSVSLMKNSIGEPAGFRGVVRDVTERKRAEEALRQSEASIKSLLKAAPIGIGLVHDRVLSWVSDQMEEMLGYSQGELAGNSARILYETDEEFECVGRDKYQQISKQGMGEIETRWQRKDGRVIDINLRSAAVDPTDPGKGITFSALDITERKRGEEALRESEERYRSLFQNNHTVMLLIDPETADIVDANPAACSFYGWDHERLTSKKITDINILAGEQVFQEMKRAKSEENQHFFFRHRLASGEIVDVEVFSGPIILNGKKLLYSIVHDITERKQAIEALRASEEKYRTVLEANPDPVVVYDIEGKVVYFNPAFTRVFGWSLGERFGREMDHFVPADNWPETTIMIDRVLAGESFSGIESRRYTKDGNVIPVSISGAVLRDMESNPVGSVINLRDVSKQKNLERQLQQAQKMEAVGTLAGGIAHDFNNLLQAIQGYTELLLLRKKEGDSDWRELQEVIRAAKRGAELTQQLLTFSRKVESKRKPLCLNQEVGELKELLERTIPKMIDVEFRLADNLKVVDADSAQLKQVLMNLAVNAQDAMAEGGSLVIETENVTLNQEFCQRYAEVKPGDYVLLSISDTGHGMDRRTLEHIFDPFYTTKEVGKGTGLGLAIVYGIIKNHEGYIMCYSQPGEGTAFRIYLPAVEAETAELAIAEPPELNDPPEGGDETILLVDDEEFIRDLGVDVLGQAGYTVLTASNAESALQLYRQKHSRIDVVILDLIMPGMGGSRCLEKLLAINPQAQIVIASGHAPDATTKKALEAGAKGFLSKPYDTRELLRLVRNICDENSQSRSIARAE